MAECGIWSVGCGIVSNNGIYDIKDLGSRNWTIELHTSYRIEFGVCKSIPCCNDTKCLTSANLLTSNGSCSEPFGPASYSLRDYDDSGKTIKAVTANYNTSVQSCDDTGRPYTFRVYIVCDPSIDKEDAKVFLRSTDKCDYEAVIKVKNGCIKVDLSVVWEFISKYYVFFCIGFILFGVLIGAFGRPMWNSIVFLLFCITVTGFFLVIFYEFVLPFNSPDWLLWLVLSISLIFGLVTAYFVARYQAAGFILLGVWFGASFTFVFKNIFFRAALAAFIVYRMWKKERVKSIMLGVGLLVIPTIYTLWANEITFWCCLVGTCTLCGVGAYFLRDLLVTLTTSFIGAYLSVRGVSIPIGGFLSEYEIYLQIKSGSLNYSNEFTAYVFVILTLTVVFTFIQEYLHNDEDKDSLNGSYNEIEY